jgi:NADH:ubiquinone reductase (H+-translocating)
VLLAFERAEVTNDLAERRSLLTFVVVGAGPTGVELAGSIAELSQRTFKRDFRAIDSATARVVLIEAGPRRSPRTPPRRSRSWAWRCASTPR